MWAPVPPARWLKLKSLKARKAGDVLYPCEYAEEARARRTWEAWGKEGGEERKRGREERKRTEGDAEGPERAQIGWARLGFETRWVIACVSGRALHLNASALRAPSQAPMNPKSIESVYVELRPAQDKRSQAREGVQAREEQREASRISGICVQLQGVVHDRGERLRGVVCRVEARAACGEPRGCQSVHRVELELEWIRPDQGFHRRFRYGAYDYWWCWELESKGSGVTRIEAMPTASPRIRTSAEPFNSLHNMRELSIIQKALRAFLVPLTGLGLLRILPGMVESETEVFPVTFFCVSSFPSAKMLRLASGRFLPRMDSIPCTPFNVSFFSPNPWTQDIGKPKPSSQPSFMATTSGLRYLHQLRVLGCWMPWICMDTLVTITTVDSVTVTPHFTFFEEARRNGPLNDESKDNVDVRELPLRRKADQGIETGYRCDRG
ncbi:hypothetical protein B0H11DRAFT_2189915 [Mycena galericulata]|nr:hypothetical protein B0H11DRAFT_2189915 [Mycena galericulata]